jgi:UDP-glucose 4-epimerase
MKVLVTGGAGYIGSHAVRALRHRGDEVVVLDRLDPGHPRAVGDARLVVGDIADATLVEATIRDEQIDAVIHFAADKSAPGSLADPGGYFRNNTAGSLALLEASVAAGVRVFVFSSTCAVYGTPEHLPVTEAAAVRPENPYGESKALVERMLPWFERAHGLRFASLRYFNAAGAHPSGELGEDWTDAANLVPAVLRAAYRGEPVHVYGTDLPTPDGSGVRDYIHVDDLAAAHLAALDHLRGGGDSLVLNLGTGRGSSVLEVIEAARRVTGRPLAIKAQPPRAGDPPAIWADPTRARDRLGWETRHDLHSMLDTAWRWHTRHPDGFGPRIQAPEAGVAAGRPER